MVDSIGSSDIDVLQIMPAEGWRVGMLYPDGELELLDVIAFAHIQVRGTSQIKPLVALDGNTHIDIAGYVSEVVEGAKFLGVLGPNEDVPLTWLKKG